MPSSTRPLLDTICRMQRSCNFALDFDGKGDVLIGYRRMAPWYGPSRIVWLSGLMGGACAPPSVTRDFPDTSSARWMAVPRRTCERYPRL